MPCPVSSYLTFFLASLSLSLSSSFHSCNDMALKSSDFSARALVLGNEAVPQAVDGWQWITGEEIWHALVHRIQTCKLPEKTWNNEKVMTMIKRWMWTGDDTETVSLILEFLEWNYFLVLIYVSIQTSTLTLLAEKLWNSVKPGTFQCFWSSINLALDGHPVYLQKISLSVLLQSACIPRTLLRCV